MKLQLYRRLRWEPSRRAVPSVNSNICWTVLSFAVDMYGYSVSAFLVVPVHKALGDAVWKCKHGMCCGNHESRLPELSISICVMD